MPKAMSRDKPLGASATLVAPPPVEAPFDETPFMATRCQPLPPGPVAIAARRSGRDGDRDMSEPVAIVADVLARCGYTPVLEENTALELGHHAWQTVRIEEIGQRCRLAVAIGGDGTFIAIARNLARFDVPLVGVNQGRLGFLTDLSLDAVEQSLPTLLAGAWREERRALLSARRDGDQETHLAFNDVVVHRGATTTLIDLQVTLDDRFAYGLRADGLIVATPTGSTAYSLSAGGAIIAPGVNAVALVPIAPHALTNRPIVVPDGTAIRIRVARAREAIASIDGHLHLPLEEGESIVLARAAATVRIWHPLDYDYFQTLREKLAWTETPETMSR